MEFLRLAFICAILASAHAAPSVTSEAQVEDRSPLVKDASTKDDLNTAASNTYTRRFSDYGSYSGGYGSGVTGYGLLDNSYYQGGLGGYDNSIGYNGYQGYNTGYGGYNKGYGGYGSSGLGYGGYGSSGLGGYGGYGSSGLGGSGGYGSSGLGGYGGYGGNGGLTSYYGYNSPYNQGAYHLGYGYYNKRPGYGNIYSSGVTPSLVTGYRGYTR